VDFGFSEEQEMLRDAVRRFLESECPPAFAREMMADATAHSVELWRKIAAQGWLGVLVPEEHGGMSGNFLDLTVVLEEAGKALLPGPFSASLLHGCTAVLAGGSSEQKRAWLPRISSGEMIFTLAVAEGSGRFDSAGVDLPARKDGKGYVLEGEKLFAADAHVADRIIVAARTRTAGDRDDGVTLFVVDRNAAGVVVEQLPNADMTRRTCRVRLDRVRVASSDVLGREHEGGSVLRKVALQAAAGASVEMVGTAQRALDLSVQYAKERVQFGKPIGSFQAVKHKCVDMLIAVENARSLCYHAAWTVAENSPDAPPAVAMAKAYTSEIGKNVCSDAIQVHGGIGFTWEHDMHLYYRRALAIDAGWGNASFHREVVAQQLDA
jgi:alkylation response protein AidB-like acyl-CoA dehydrogenase